MTNALKRALISVSDKAGIVDFARFLASRGVEILSTGGTAALLKGEGIAVRDVAEVTGFPEMLDGRVKTLHPAIHGGILARRDTPEHMQTIAAHAIAPIDLVVVSLYPFEATVARTEDAETIIENIDIGGPAMIRSAAKNFDAVTVIVDAADYTRVCEAMTAEGAVPLALRRELAGKAIARTSAYDTAIARWFAASAENGDGFADYMLDGEKLASLRYGENPHQAAALYRAGTAGVANAEQLQGKELSYNNLNDTDAAWALVQEFDRPAVALIKHANPCGVAMGANAAEAFAKALACDPVSAFGGILATNRAVDAALVAAIGSLFLEVIVAPEVTGEARALLAAKKNLRVLVAQQDAGRKLTIKSISGGYLVQTEDAGLYDAAALKCVTKISVNAAQQTDLQFAFAVAKHVKSNAIVLAKNGATIGIGAGQMSRIDSVKIACEKARVAGLSTRGAVLASDAFFPFADNVEAAHAAGVAAVIQPGGSMRDPEVIAAADAVGLAMLFTGTRHFRH
jgi:phosphoribosylaminoimidazolecarboxamide formyltransferase/IMP cyclohydrolase